MKRRNEAGFSLIEVLVSITILAAVVLPTCSALLLGIQLNDKTDALMRAQLSVSSAVETLMAEGIDADDTAETLQKRFPDVQITMEAVDVHNQGTTYYNVSVSSRITDADDVPLVRVSTAVAAVPAGPSPADPSVESEVEE